MSGYKHSRPKGHVPYRPQKKTRRILAQVEEVLGQYADHLPLTLRQIFYRLVAIYGYDKSERAYDRLGEYLNRARRARMIPWEAIRDDGWVQECNRGWLGPDDFWEAVKAEAEGYTRDKQARQPRRLVLLVEAAGMVPQVRRVADPFSVPVMSSSGFDSLTVKKGLADRVLEEPSRPMVFLHIGDRDPSGECIFDAAKADVEAFIEGQAQVVFERIALTEAQVEKYQLPTAPPKATDKRGNRIRETCQVEALPPDTLLDIVREAVERNSDMPRFRSDMKLEKLEREELLGWL